MNADERRIFWIVAMIGLVFCLWSGYSIAKGEQFTRKDKCERWAAFAVELRKDKDAGVIVNVSPNLERFKQMVWGFEGTEEELKEQVLADCLFVRT